jgi:curved DNA-binding protein CbpA
MMDKGSGKGQTPFEILGIPEDADARMVKRAYRRLAKKFHPDLNPDDPQAERMFKQIQQAYESVMAPAHEQSTADPGNAFYYTSGYDPSFAFFEAMENFRMREKP